jgi:hypothetical protein
MSVDDAEKRFSRRLPSTDASLTPIGVGDADAMEMEIETRTRAPQDLGRGFSDHPVPFLQLGTL